MAPVQLHSRCGCRMSPHNWDRHFAPLQDEGVRLSALSAEQAAALLAAQPRKTGNKSFWLRALINQVLNPEP